ncbi:hypothetical protein MMC26_001287 [Xylographa opegraphella]|nr:hypothetical protein [Xylographa opegraphella]
MNYQARKSIIFIALTIPFLLYSALSSWRGGLPQFIAITSLSELGLKALKQIFRMPQIEPNTHFRTLQKFKSEFSPNQFTQYESQRTGMRVVVVDQEGPKVLGYFALATEIHDDSGAPHTLEHLCFMGSKSYPYKGVLDKLATRAYSNTNAWTATDHTCYTLDTAGWAGFAQILPVYLEHVIVPTLTDAGCYTEVYHMDGTGHDAGVVYSEMQGCQNTQPEIMDLKSKRIMYPEGVGFRYETGGMMEQLRVLQADRIRQFHREMYQPKNLCLILVGEIDHSDLLTILDNFESTILEDIPKPDTPFKRPWVESPQPPPLKESTIDTIEFPEDDETSGEISISFFGPSCTDVLGMGALNILMTYIAGSSVSVLENILVEKEQVASAVYYSWETRPNTVIQFTLSSVDAEKLAEVEARFFEVLKETTEKKLDMEYMLDCISRHRRKQMSASENGAIFFTDSIIADFLFGNKSTMKNIATLREFDELESWTDVQWRDFLRKWISDAPHVTILGKPSAAMSERLKADEESRISERKAELGEEGLKRLEKKLAAAKAENDKEIPREILEKFKTPDTNSIHFIKTTTARSGVARGARKMESNPIQKIIDQDPSELPLFIHFEHIQSNFVHISILIGTESVPVALRPLLSIYLDNFFTSPIMRNGTRIEFERAVMELERDTVDYSLETGASLGCSEGLRLSIQVEAKKYEIGIQWLRDFIWNSIFDTTRVKASTAKLLADIPEEKRDGSTMTWSAALMTNTAPESIGRARDTLVKALYLKRVKRLLETEPDTILSQLEMIRQAIGKVSNFRVLVIANVETLKKPVSAWEALATTGFGKLAPLDKRLGRLSEAGKHPGNLAYITPLAIDSSFAYAVGKGPQSLQDPQVPALRVAMAYLDAVEGPMWTAVRGTGLAYGTGFSRSIDSGHVTFSIYRSPDVSKAFKASRDTLQGFISGTTSFDSLALEGAISSIVLDFANNQATMAASAHESFIRQVVRDLPNDWNDHVLKRVRNVTVEEVRKAMGNTLLPLFTAESTNLFVTCAAVMQEGLVKGFESMGFRPEVKPLTFFQDDYGLKAGDEEDGKDDDDDDDDIDDEDEEMEGSEEEQMSDTSSK